MAIYLNNTLPSNSNIGVETINNSMFPDRPLDSPLSKPFTPGYYESSKMIDLDDIVRVRPTIENCRKAIQIEPLARASVLMMVILACSDFEIVSKDGANLDSLETIRDLSRDVWNMEELLFGGCWRCIVDGKGFSQKVIDKETEDYDILRTNFLVYDEKDYDMLKLEDPETKKLLGYMQHGVTFKYPTDWNKIENGIAKYSFDELVNVETEVKDIPLLPEQVMHWEMFNDGLGLVKPILDDVYGIKRLTIENPEIVINQLALLYIQLGSEKFPYTPYKDFETPAVKEERTISGIKNAVKTFTDAKAEGTGIVGGTQAVNPKFVGQATSKGVDISNSLNLHAHRIYIGLLTPPGRWEGSGTNKASIVAQIGDGGQLSAVYYMQSRMKKLVEKDLFNHQLKLLGDEDSIDKIKLNFKIKNFEDREKLAKILKIVEEVYPATSQTERDQRLEVYAPEYFKKMQESMIVNTNLRLNENPIIPATVSDTVKPLITKNGIVDTNYTENILNMVGKVKHKVEKEGVFDE